MTESDIRPKVATRNQKNSILIDLGRLLSQRNKFVEVNCPACQSTKYKHCFTKNGLDYATCQKCQTLFVNPRPTVAVLNWFYANSEVYKYWNKHIFPQSEKARTTQIVVPRVDRLLSCCDKFNIPTDSLVEIGAAFGSFCVEAKNRNRFKRILAVEPMNELAKTCKSRGLETVNAFVEKIPKKYDSQFNVLVSFEVIEHLFSPAIFLKQCRNLLKSGGIIYLSCPNRFGFDLLTLGKTAGGFDHEHLNYFHPKSLAFLLSSCGFKILEQQTPGQLDAEIVRNRALEGNYDISQEPFLKYVLVDHWTEYGEKLQNFLRENGLSSSMIVIARKI